MHQDILHRDLTVIPEMNCSFFVQRQGFETNREMTLWIIVRLDSNKKPLISGDLHDDR